MIRVFLADDHAVVRCGVKQVLTELGGFAVVGEAEDGRQVLNAPELARCDVLVLDLSLPKVSGPEVLRRVRARYPHVAVVVLSMHPEDQFAARALADGAAAYLSKGRPPADLIRAVVRAARGQRDAPPADAEPAAPPHTRLTRREHQIFGLVVAGRSVVEAAAELDVHACTVSNHLASVKRKLGAGVVADLVRYAIAHGLTTASPDFAAPDGEGHR
jgi:DNA-binding NarL/FixJ family response regulator